MPRHPGIERSVCLRGSAGAFPQAADGGAYAFDPPDQVGAEPAIELLPGREPAQAVGHLLEQLARLLHPPARGLAVARVAGGRRLVDAAARLRQRLPEVRPELAEAVRVVDLTGENAEAAA